MPKWWVGILQQEKKQFPLLSVIVQNYKIILGVPTTSLPSEHIFSFGCQIHHLPHQTLLYVLGLLWNQTLLRSWCFNNCQLAAEITLGVIFTSDDKCNWRPWWLVYKLNKTTMSHATLNQLFLAYFHDTPSIWSNWYSVNWANFIFTESPSSNRLHRNFKEYWNLLGIGHFIHDLFRATNSEENNVPIRLLMYSWVVHQHN